MHRGCFVWTSSPPLEGRRTPRPGPVRVCVCLSFLAGLGGPASRVHFGAPPLFLWPLCLSALLGPLLAGVASFLGRLFALPLLPLSRSPPRFFRAPFVSCFLPFPAQVALGLGALFFFPPPPGPLFFLPPLSLGFSGVQPLLPRALALCAVCFARPPLLGPPCPLAPSAAPWWLIPPPPPFVSRAFRRRLSVLGVICAPSLSVAFAGFLPWMPWALALSHVFFVGLPLLCSLCGLVWCFPPRRWPLFAGCCDPPPPPSVALFSSPPLGAPSFFFLRAFVLRPRCLLPRCLWLSLVSSPGALGLCAVCFSF